MKVILIVPALLISAAALSAPPPGLSSALSAWAAPRSVERYQFAFIDLNSDGALDVVVHVTDPNLCGGGGCPLVAFRKTPTAYELVASSGMVRKPIYALEEVRDGWLTLAAVACTRVVPIRYDAQKKAYNQFPCTRSEIELTSPLTREALNFVEAP